MVHVLNVLSTKDVLAVATAQQHMKLQRAHDELNLNIAHAPFLLNYFFQV